MAIQVDPSTGRVVTVAPSGVKTPIGTTQEDVVGFLAAAPAASRDALMISAAPPELIQLKTALDTGFDASFAVITDSTGNATDEWVYQTAVAIGAKYPTHRVNYMLFDDTTKAWALTQVQAGTGGDRLLNIPATGALFGYQFPTSALYDTFGGGDLEIQVEYSIEAAGSGETVLIFWPSVGAGGRGWLEVDGLNKPILNWSEDNSGTTLKTAYSTAALPTLTVGQKYTIKATLDINNGAGAYEVKFWYSTNSGNTWTQLGGTVVGPSTTTVAFTLSEREDTYFTIASRGSAPIANRKFYRAQIYKGIGGLPLLPERIDMWQHNTSGLGNTVSLAGAPVLTVWNNAQSSWKLATHIAQAAPHKAYHDQGNVFWLIASSHNEEGRNDFAFGRSLDSLVTILRTYSKATPPIVVCSQNPETTVAVWEPAHNKRGALDLRLAASKRGYPFIDVYSRWIATPNWETLINPADGVHPLATGTPITVSAIMNDIGLF